ncbi:unnamed protein product [Ixodes hexagonus]
MVNCAVFGCSNRSQKKVGSSSSSTVQFFRFLTVITTSCCKTRDLSTARRREWVRRVNRADMKDATAFHRICGVHFVTGEPSALFDPDHPDWAPSLLLGHKKKFSRGIARYNRRKTRDKAKTKSQKEPAQHAANTTPEPGSDADDPATNPNAGYVHGGCSPTMAHTADRSAANTTPEPGPDADNPTTNPDAGYVHGECSRTMAHTADLPARTGIPAEVGSILEKPIADKGMQADDGAHKQVVQYQKELNILRLEVYFLRENLERKNLTEEAFRNNEELTKYYTGLPNFGVLHAVFELVKRLVRHSPNNVLTQFQEFIVTLIRLRLNTPLQDLAHRFGVSEATISRSITKWVDGLYVDLDRVVRWPTRKQLKRTMPMCFRAAFGTDVAVVIDCFEVFIEKPTSHMARSLTWSQYKHHNTVKYLIGIAPQGTVTFISRGWCGRSSDKLIAESSGILENLQPGDCVLADRGFTIEESVGLYCARLHMPAFTRGQKPLAPWSVEATRKLANVRIHVERVIGLIRNKYVITKSVIPIDLLCAEGQDRATTLDKIVFVCCALASLCDSVVQFD